MTIKATDSGKPARHSLAIIHIFAAQKGQSLQYSNLRLQYTNFTFFVEENTIPNLAIGRVNVIQPMYSSQREISAINCDFQIVEDDKFGNGVSIKELNGLFRVDQVGHFYELKQYFKLKQYF